MRRIYLDYAATTPIDYRVLAAMRPYEREKFGNPSSLHRFGQEASAAVFAARRKVASAIGADPGEVVFTASATEANNLAITGSVLGARSLGSSKKGKIKIIVAATEHESVLEPAHGLTSRGVEVVVVPVSEEGIVDVDMIRKAIDRRTAIVSVGYANSETGAVQPISEIAGAVRAFRESHRTPYPLFHTDAVQALPYLDCAVNIMEADLVTLSSHKVYGPKGAAALYARGVRAGGIENRKSVSKNSLSTNHYPLKPILTGGDQEMGFRAGTENVPAIVGFGEAAVLVARERRSDARRANQMRNRLLAGIKGFWRGAILNGPPPGPRRIPGNLNVYLPGISAAELLVRLDLLGIAASAGSACAARTPEPSHVLLAMGLGAERAKGSIRFTVGRETTERDIGGAIKALQHIHSAISKERR